MSLNKVRIVNLKDYPQFIETVATWVFNEFTNPNSDKDLDFIIKHFKDMNYETIPLSFIALEDEECAGVISIFENDLSTRPELTPWLAGLYVDETFRGHGIAKMLIGEVTKKCKEMNYKKVYLRTEHTSEYYKKLGWIILEETVDELGQETTVFYKEL